MTENIECRLCGGSAELVFQKKILSKHQVGYYQCRGCGSLETESPFWLAEAYDPINERFDTGQLIRSFDNAAFVAVLISYLGLEKSRVVDYGCGSGLLVRLMRDVGFDVWGFDAYSLPRLAIGFHSDSLVGASVVNLSEVAEHFDHPGKYFDQIFSCGPELLIVQTNLFDNPNPDWDYLAADHGQHVFFYSHNAIGYLAQRYGMKATRLNGFIVFFKSFYLDKLFNPNSSIIRSELQKTLNEATPILMNQILMNGYKYAIEDNLALRAEKM
jgi:SAM-dependent methyltransferase